MALKLDINFNGLVVPDAYVKVNSFEGDKMNLAFNVSTSVTAGYCPFMPIKSYCCSHDINAGNPLEQAYDYLKTLPDFSDATDC